MVSAHPATITDGVVAVAATREATPPVSLAPVEQPSPAER